MKKEEIALLYKYNTWANARILDTTSKITHEQFAAPTSFPRGGLHGTLVHILSAECTWRKRWEDISPVPGIKPEEVPTFESLRARWRVEEKALTDFVDSQSEESLNNRLQYKDTKGNPHENVLWQMMIHVITHGMQHRSEAAAMLTDLGHSPGDIDLIVFLREQG